MVIEDEATITNPANSKKRQTQTSTKSYGVEDKLRPVKVSTGFAWVLLTAPSPAD